MDQLVIRVLQGAATRAEWEKVGHWRNASAKNDRHFRELAAIWQATAVPADCAFSARPRSHEIVRAAEGEGQHLWNGRRVRRVWQAGAVAAALLLGLIIGDSRPERQPVGQALEAAEFVTGPMELATARLSDGSVVRLAPSTRLRVSGSDRSREVWLDGKAFFAVTSDHLSPFTVRTRAGEALVLGTRFEVDVSYDDLRVLVVEGLVEVGPDNHRVQVEAGTHSRTPRGLPPELSVVEEVSTHLSWMGSFLAFENTPLRQVAVELAARYQIRVEIADSALAERTVTAWFGDEDPETVLRLICRIADAHCSIRDRVASIEP